MKALLVQYGLEEALDGEVALAPTMTVAEKRPIMTKALSMIQFNLLNKVLREICNQTLTPELWQKLESSYMTKSLTNRLYLRKWL